MEGRSVLHSCYLISGETATVPTEQEAGWAPESVWVLWTREYLLSWPFIKPISSAVQCV